MRAVETTNVMDFDSATNAATGGDNQRPETDAAAAYRAMLDAIAKIPLKDPDLFRQANHIGGAWVQAMEEGWVENVLKR